MKTFSILASLLFAYAGVTAAIEQTEQAHKMDKYDTFRSQVGSKCGKFPTNCNTLLDHLITGLREGDAKKNKKIGQQAVADFSAALRSPANRLCGSVLDSCGKKINLGVVTTPKKNKATEAAPKDAQGAEENLMHTSAKDTKKDIKDDVLGVKPKIPGTA